MFISTNIINTETIRYVISRKSSTNTSENLRKYGKFIRELKNYLAIKYTALQNKIQLENKQLGKS